MFKQGLSSGSGSVCPALHGEGRSQAELRPQDSLQMSTAGMLRLP